MALFGSKYFLNAKLVLGLIKIILLLQQMIGPRQSNQSLAQTEGDFFDRN